MSGYLTYYLESSVVCLLIFAIMLIHDLRRVDRQEKQIKYDHALIAFMLYFVSDSFWAMIIDDMIPKTMFSVALVNFANYILMAAITYTWLRYVLAVEQVPHREKPINRFRQLLPFLVATVALCVTFLIDPHVLIDDTFNTTIVSSIFQIAVPIIYIIAVLVYTLRRAAREENPAEKKNHLYTGIFPLMVVAGGLVQVVLLPDVPVFCFCCTLLMLIFYIKSMETQISMDPLTGINNRGQLLRFVSQDSNLHVEGRHTFVIMMDVNEFKDINDTYGHAAGDSALIIIAEAMKKVAKNQTMPIFLGRYGGDEFILIVHSLNEEEVCALISEIREQIVMGCKDQDAPFIISIGAGYDELQETGSDNFQDCMQRADEKLYQDKEYLKSHGIKTLCN